MALFGPSKQDYDLLRSKYEEKKKKLEALQNLMTPEQQQVQNWQGQIVQLTQQRDSLQTRIQQTGAELNRLWSEVKAKKSQIIQLDDEILMQEFGLYKPKYDLANSDAYKNRLAVVRQRQKDMIKASAAVTGATGWTVNGNAAQGRKMVADTQKLLLRAFNAECDEVVAKVKYNNYDVSLKRISASATAISKLGAMMQIAITDAFYALKIEELTIALEYQQKKQQEKEEQKAAREQMKEEAKLQREIEDKRRELEKEQTHYSRALSQLNVRLNNATEIEADEIKAKIAEIERKLEDIGRAKADVDYRQANKRAGYVYIISNIGAFGEGVYKIGMTRRLEPLDRVDELGDASVPFRFDVHAMLFSDDAPALEASLHIAFDSRKLNMVNQRKEFFRVSLDEIKAVVQQNYDKIAEFIDIPDAEQYRVSEKMRSAA